MPPTGEAARDARAGWRVPVEGRRSVRPRSEVWKLVPAHANTAAIEAAYRRTDLFERQRALMEQWAE